MNDNTPITPLIKKPILEGKHPAIQLLYMVLLIFGCGIVISTFGLLLSFGIWGTEVKEPTAGYYRFLQVFNAIGVFLVPALLFSYLQRKRWFSYSQADCRPNNGTTLIYVAAAAICILPLAGIMVELGKLVTWPDFMAKWEEWMHEQQASVDHVLEMMTTDTHISTLILNLLVCALLPAVCEEFFFRGALQQLLHHWFKNSHAAIWVTGFIFSAIHLQIDGFVARWLLGVYLGYLLVWSGSLWVPILAHFLHNALSIIIQHIVNVNGTITEENLTHSSIFFSLLALGFFIFFIYLIYRSSHKNQVNQA